MIKRINMQAQKCHKMNEKLKIKYLWSKNIVLGGAWKEAKL